MADVELVIKIPEELYETYKGRPLMLGDAGMDMIAQSIANGTPLPKGHGALKDTDAMLSEMKDLKKSPWYKDRTNFAHLPRKEAVQIIEEIIIGNAPTIIEADKEAEDGI